MPCLRGLLFTEPLFACIFPHIFGDLHCAKMRPTHGTEMRRLGAVPEAGFRRDNHEQFRDPDRD